MGDTDKFGLNKPEYDDSFWNLPINENFDKIDTALARASGVSADDPDVISPSLQNRILRIQDGAGNDLEIYQVYIPEFVSENFPDENLNGVLCGGFWLDKFQACQPAASASTRGGLTPNSPGTGVGAACKPMVVPWTDISQINAKAVIENRGGSANQQAGTCAVYSGATDATAEFLLASIEHKIGRYIEIVQDGVTYIRRILSTGMADTPTYVRLNVGLPAAISTEDTYTVMEHYLPGGYEWFSLLAWTLKYRAKYGLGQCKGNNDWGKDYQDSRSLENEGLPDPVKSGYSGNNKSRCLTGSGPLSWSLNGKADGPFDLNGNAWEWGNFKVVTDGSGMVVAPGYPGAGTSVLPSGSSGQRVMSLYAPSAPVDGRSLGAELFIPATVDSSGEEKYGLDGCWWNITANTYAARRGGTWHAASLSGLSALPLLYTPTRTGYDITFRGAA